MSKFILNSRDNVKTWFDLQALPFWALYNGHGTAKNGGYISRNNEFEDLDQSWSRLDNILSLSETGNFTITLADAPNTQNWKAKSFIAFSKESSYTSNPLIHGIGSPGVGTQVAISGGISEYLKDQKRLWTLEEKLSNIEQNGVPAVGNVEYVVGLISELGIDFNPIVQMLTAAAVNKFATKKTGAMNGNSKKAQLDHLDQKIEELKKSKQLIESGSKETDTEEEVFNVNKSVADSLLKIEKHFPKLDEFLFKLSAFIEMNPDNAKNIFNGKK